MIKRIFTATIGKRLILFIFSVVLIPTAIVLVLFYGRFSNIIEESLLDSQVVTSLLAAKSINNTAETLLSVCNTIMADERLPVLLALGAREDGGGSGDGNGSGNGSGSGNTATTNDMAMETLSAVIDSHVSSSSLSAIRIYVDLPAVSAGSGSAEGQNGSEDAGSSEDPENATDQNSSDSSGGAALIQDNSEIRNTYWYGIFTGMDIDTLFAPEFFLSTAERTAYGSLAVIRKQEFIVDGERITVFVAVYTYDDILASPIRDIGMESVEGIISFILDSRDTVVAQTDETAYGTYAMNFEDIARHIPIEGVFIQREVAGTEVFMTYRDIDSTDWRMAWIVPQASIMAQSRHVIFQFIAIYLLMTALVLIIGLVQSNAIVRRIKSLRNQMRQIKTERPKPLTLLPGKDEVGELIETYNYMVERINTLLDDTIEAAEELKSEELKALRAQIDPHFLYNTLDMIKWLIKAGSNDKASEAIIALSRFYRLTLNRGVLTATVAAELEHVSLYIRLMNMRFDEKIEYLIDMPEDMLEYEIPMIVFQPIVENAIQHGIFEKPSKSGKIIITGWSEDDMLCFLISDDGIGMTAEQISRLLPADLEVGAYAEGEARAHAEGEAGAYARGEAGAYARGEAGAYARGEAATQAEGGAATHAEGEAATHAEAGTGSGIGAYNTHRRLQLMCGRDDCGLKYSSEYGKGTDVTFRIHKSLRGSAKL